MLRRVRLARQVLRRVARLSDQLGGLVEQVAALERHLATLEAGQQEVAVADRDRVTGRLDELRTRLDALTTDRDELLGVRPPAGTWDVSRPPRRRVGIVDELRDSVHLVARRRPVRRPVRVLFLVHLIETWDSTDGIVRAMLESDDFEPVVATVPRHFRGEDRPVGEAELSAELTARGVQHIRFATVGPDTLRLIKYLDPDLVFRQSQWDADVPEAIGADHLSFARLCLSPYEPMNIVENVLTPDGTDPGFDSDLHRAAWAVFSANDLVKRRAAARSARGGDNVHVVGHPKADRLRTVKPDWPLDERPDARRIVWSAHHSVATGWTDFGMFPAVAEDMLAWARERPQDDFVFSLHPALRGMIASPISPYSTEQFADWRARWDALPNTAVLSGRDYMPVLAASDVLVSDGLSLLVEYQVLTKPVVFLERDGHRPFNEIGQLVRSGVHPARTVDRARALVDELAGHDDPLADRQREVVAELFGPAQPTAAERVLDVLRALLAHEPARELVEEQRPGPS